MSAIEKLVVRIGADTAEKTFVGRAAWALDALIRAGVRGCTPITTPGPRWSDYVFKLRRGGVPVETIEERHAGPYAGSHARYVLGASITVLEEERAS